jgi:hypothetical protein
MLPHKGLALATALLAAAATARAGEGVPYNTPKDEPSRVERGLFHQPVRLTAAGRVIDSGPSWGHCGPWVEDVDGDGARDLIVGDFSGFFRIYHNRGTNTAPQYDAGVNLKAGNTDAQVPIY